MSAYSDKFKDGRWQKKRLEIMERDKFTCRSCGAKGDDGATLNVHHAWYEKGKSPWEYPQQALVTWCQDCHKHRHEVIRFIQQAIAHMTRAEFGGLCELCYANTPGPLLSAIDAVSVDSFINTRVLADMVYHLADAYKAGVVDSGGNREA